MQRAQSEREEEEEKKETDTTEHMSFALMHQKNRERGKPRSKGTKQHARSHPEYVAAASQAGPMQRGPERRGRREKQGKRESR